MFSIKDYEYDCTEKCRSRQHGNLITAAVTKRNIPDDKLAIYITTVCCNFKNICDDEGRSAVHMASSMGRYRILSWLLNQKAKIDLRDSRNGSTPLHLAIYYGNIDCAVLLLRFGAKLDALDNDKRCPLQNVCRYCDDKVPSNNDLVVWGSNKDGILGIGSKEYIETPQFINFFHKEKITVKLCALGAYHSLFLDENNHLYAVGYGKDGRLGNGTESSLIFPEKIKVPIKNQEGELIVCISVSRKHSLLLTNRSVVFACGLNNDGQLGVHNADAKLNIFTQITTFQDLGAENLLCVIARDFHSIAYSAKSIYVWGRNYGQFGMENEKIILFPKKVIQLPSYTSIQFVEADDCVTVCYTRENFILLFYNHRMKKIVPPSFWDNDRIKSISIVGGNKVRSTRTSETSFKMILLTVKNLVYLWNGTSPAYHKLDFSQQNITKIDKIIYKANQFLLLSQGDVYIGKFLQWFPKTQMDFKYFASIDRTVDVFCNDEFTAFGAMQENCRKYFNLPNLKPFVKTFEKLLYNANISDSIHDLVFHVGGEQFPAHKLIISVRSKFLAEMILKSPGKHIHLTNDGLTGKMFKLMLKFIYTNYYPTEDDIDSFEESNSDLEHISKRLLALQQFQQIAEEFELFDLVKILKTSECNISNGSKHDFHHLAFNDFPSLYDIRIISADGIEISAHKCILVSRLEYFETMFAHSWAEKSEVHLRTMPSEYLRPIIDFTYTLNIEEFREKNYSEEYLCNMIVYCDEFFVENLRKVCEILLLNEISIERCDEMLEFASFYNCNVLKNGCFDFICQNLARILASKCLETIDWEILKCINRHYREMFTSQFDCRTIESASGVFDDDALLSFLEDLKIDLDSHLNENDANKRKRMLFKVQKKHNKIKQNMRQHEREAVAKMLHELYANDAEEAKENVKKSLQNGEKINENFQLKNQKWFKVVSKSKTKKKNSTITENNCLTQSENMKKTTFVKKFVPRKKIEFSDSESDSSQSTLPLSERTYNFTLDAFENPLSCRKISQKQRKRFLSELREHTKSESTFQFTYTPPPVPPVPSTNVPNAWGSMTTSSLFTNSPEESGSIFFRNM